MGLGNFLIKRTAKSTASSIAKYLNGGTFDTPDDALRAWASTRRNGSHLVMMVDGLANFSITPDKARIASTSDIAEALFYAEMDMEKSSLSPEVVNEIKSIFRTALR
jgi:hypothetical protein